MGRLFKVWIMSMALSSAYCQPSQPTVEKVRLLTDYLGLQASENELQTLALLVAKVENKELLDSVRLESFEQLMQMLARHLNLDTVGLKGPLLGWAQRQTLRYNLPVFEEVSYPATPYNTLGEVKKFGNGKTPVILIPEYRKNWSIFEEFIQANLARYTFYAITLPGYNGTLPYALPDKYDFSNRVWLNSVAEGVVNLVDDQKLEKPLVVGALNAGSYIATMVVSKIPGKVGGLILLNGALRETEGSLARATPEGRAKEINRDFSNVIFHLLKRNKFTESQLDVLMKRKLSPGHPINYYSNDTVKVRRVLRMHNAFASITERYDLEWRTADLTSTIKSLKVPVLVALADYDSGWPFGQPVNHLIEEWNTLKKESGLNLRITILSNSRLVLTLDKPEAVGVLLDAFVSGKPIPERVD